METVVNVPTRIDKACAKASSRYAINGVKISPHTDDGRAWLTATDGHLLAAVPTDIEGDRNPSDYMPASVVPTSGRDRHVTRNGQWQNAKGKFAPIEDNPGNFPPCHDVMPDIDPDSPDTMVIGLDAKLLLNLAQALGSDKVYLIVAKSDLKVKGEKQKYGDPPRYAHTTKPIRVVPGFDDGAEGFGVLMPVSGDSNPAAYYKARRDQYRTDYGKHLSENK